jgi:hypothetical protein
VALLRLGLGAHPLATGSSEQQLSADAAASVQRGGRLLTMEAARAVGAQTASIAELLRVTLEAGAAGIMIAGRRSLYELVSSAVEGGGGAPPPWCTAAATELLVACVAVSRTT